MNNEKKNAVEFFKEFKDVALFSEDKNGNVLACLYHRCPFCGANMAGMTWGCEECGAT